MSWSQTSGCAARANPGRERLAEGNPELTVTEAAAAHLAQMLAEAEVAGDTVLRSVRTERGFAPELDSAGPADATFDHEGRTALVLDEQVSELLAERTLGLRDTGEGPRLTLV